jgi:hypothetical protein
MLGAAATPGHACLNSFENDLEYLFQRGDQAGIENVLAGLETRFARADRQRIPLRLHQFEMDSPGRTWEDQQVR